MIADGRSQEVLHQTSPPKERNDLSPREIHQIKGMSVANVTCLDDLHIKGIFGFYSGGLFRSE